jgi:hypothetical protein
MPLSRPTKIESPDTKMVQAAVEDYLSEMERGEPSSETAFAVFEAVLESLYGKGIWDYVLLVAKSAKEKQL